MNGLKSLIVILVSYGNAYLSGLIGRETADLPSDFSILQVISSLQFAFRQDGTDMKAVRTLSGCFSWFDRARVRGATRLSAIDENKVTNKFLRPIAQVFCGTMIGGIQIDFKNGCECWYPQWTVNRGASDETRIWDVVVHGHLAKVSLRAHPIALDRAKNDLNIALRRIQKFSSVRLSDEPHWQKLFSHAIELLNGDPVDMHELLPPAGYSRTARQLLAAASACDVFGGMGSWNDNCLDRAYQSEYAGVTGGLHGAMEQAIVSAVNSFGDSLS